MMDFYAQLFEGKRVCVVGERPVKTAECIEIDQCDVVVRVGEQLPIAEDRKSTKGTKTTVLAHNFFNWSEPSFDRKAALLNYRDANLKGIRYLWVIQNQLYEVLTANDSKQLNVPITFIDPELFRTAFSACGPKTPSLELLAIIDTIKQPCASVYLTGFDFSKNPKESEYLAKLIGESNRAFPGRITVDDEMDLHLPASCFPTPVTEAPEAAPGPIGIPGHQGPAGVRVYVALPTYDEMSATPQMFPIMKSPDDGAVRIQSFYFSILTYVFNWLWCDALNRRKEGITHFAMVHSDIIPQEGWLRIMLEEMAKTGADVLSAVVPIKDTQGLTSTGISLPQIDPWAVKRLTMKEIFERPETFTHPQLVVNSGLMLVDFRKPWVEDFFFHIEDKITKLPNGQFVPAVQSEDWNLSVRARAVGAKIYATRRVKLEHRGAHKYPNNKPWGSCESDPAWKMLRGV